MKGDEMPKTPEFIETVDQMLIFDVDGVITDPKEKKVTQPQILDEIIKKLAEGEPVALNTGRSIEWLKDRVLNPLIEKVKDTKILQNLFSVGEKGGTWAEFDVQGKLILSKDDNITVPESLKNKIRDLINEKHSDSMFYDESKLTMISTEMKDEYPLEDYREKQKILSAELLTLLTKNNLTDRFKIDPTTIATDIENEFVGKNFAIKRIMNWVKQKGLQPKQYLTLGDSFKSDIPMAEQLFADNLPVQFIYVGKEAIDVSKYPFPIKQTENKFDKGTLEFLKTL